MVPSLAASSQLLAFCFFLSNVFGNPLGDLRPRIAKRNQDRIKPKVFLIDMVSRATLSPSDLDASNSSRPKARFGTTFLNSTYLRRTSPFPASRLYTPTFTAL